MEKTIYNLYLECISDLAEAVGELRRQAGASNKFSQVANDLEFRADYHLRHHTRLLREEVSHAEA